jgi:hypothetical protein
MYVKTTLTVSFLLAIPNLVQLLKATQRMQKCRQDSGCRFDLPSIDAHPAIATLGNAAPRINSIQSDINRLNDDAHS